MKNNYDKAITYLSYLRYFIRKENTLFIFLILAIVVFLLQFTLLDLALKIGFKPDDWILYFTYKTLGSDPLSRLPQIWAERGIYTTYQIYYIGLLEKLVGFNFYTFQVVNLIFKSLGTLAIFPLVLVIFRNKILAILTTLLFAISPSSIGPLEFVVKGSDYISLFWLCLFLTVYYLIAKNYLQKFTWVLISLILLLLAVIFSPIRVFPLVVLLAIFEIYLLINNLELSNAKKSLIRLSLFYLPLLALVLYAPDSFSGLLGGPLGIFKKVTEGNWHLILSPFSGMGYTFITNDYWGKLFGSLSIESIEKYLSFLLGGPTVIFGLLTLIVAFLNSKRPWSFFLFTLILNFTFEILVFFVATHSKYLPSGQQLHYEPTGIYSVLFGIYILVLGITSFMEWVRKDRDNNLLLAFWLGPLFLFVFTFTTWAFAPFGTNFSSTSYYLIIASIGSALFIAAFLLSIYKRVISIRNSLVRSVLLVPIFLVIILIVVMNGKEIRSRFLDLLANGRSAHGQQVIQGTFREHIEDIDFSKPALFYFDTSDIPGEGPFYSEGFLGSFPFWMHFQNGQLIDSCIEVLYLNEHKQLLFYIREQDGERGFFFRGLCVEGGRSSYKEIFYKSENFYAFKIKSRDFIDIKEQILKELGF